MNGTVPLVRRAINSHPASAPSLNQARKLTKKKEKEKIFRIGERALNKLISASASHLLPSKLYDLELLEPYNNKEQSYGKAV